MKNILSANNKDKENIVIFFGDSYGKKILEYNFSDDHFSFIEFNHNNLNDLHFNHFEHIHSKASSFSGGKILITGGFILDNNQRTVTRRTSLVVYNKEKSLSIEAFKPMLNNRFSHGCIISNDTPYVFGGNDGKQAISCVEYYDRAEHNWKFLSYMNISRECFSYCLIEQRYIFVFGGCNEDILDSIERYDIIYDKWKLLDCKMKRPLKDATACAIDNNRIVLIGGNDTVFHKCVDLFDIENKNWVSLASMSIPRARSHVIIYKDHVNIILCFKYIDFCIRRGKF